MYIVQCPRGSPVQFNAFITFYNHRLFFSCHMGPKTWITSMDWLAQGSGLRQQQISVQNAKNGQNRYQKEQIVNIKMSHILPG